MGEERSAEDVSVELQEIARTLPIARGCAARAELERQDYSAALELLEARLIESPAVVENRLGWVECQLALATVPLTALSAPLEELFPAALEMPDVRPFASRTFVAVASKLVQRRQLRLAVVILEHALALSVGADWRGQLVNATLFVMRQELERAEIKRESKAYAAALRERIEKLEKDALTQEPPPRQEKERALFTSKAIVEAALLLEDTAPETAAVLERKERTSWFRAGLFVGGALAVLAGLGWLLLPQETPEEISDRLVDGVRLPAAEVSMLPETDFAPLSNQVSLDELRKRLESKPPVTVPTPADTPVTVAVVVPTAAPNSKPKNNSLPPPKVDADRLARTRVEDLGTTPPVREGHNDRALDGSPLRSYEVEQFPEPLNYKIIARTQVMSAPSVVAASLAQLEPDAKVQVVSRMGRWLELRSLAGRRGFIYAQDAVQIQNPDSR